MSPVLDNDDPISSALTLGQDQTESAKLRQILDGARRVFLADGYDGASMNDIARTAGVSKGTLYVYFESKEILLEALIRDLKRAQGERHICFETSTDEVEENLRQSALHLSRKILQPEHIAIIRLVIGVAHKLPQVGRAFYESGPLYGRARLSAYLDHMVTKGILNIENTDLAAGQFLQLAYSELINLKLFRMVDEISDYDLLRAIDPAIAMFMAAYAKGKQRPHS